MLDLEWENRSLVDNDASRSWSPFIRRAAAGSNSALISVGPPRILVKLVCYRRTIIFQTLKCYLLHRVMYLWYRIWARACRMSITTNWGRVKRRRPCLASFCDITCNYLDVPLKPVSPAVTKRQKSPVHPRCIGEDRPFPSLEVNL